MEYWEIAILPTYNSNVTLYEDEQHVCYIDNITVNPVPTGINNQNTEKLMINYSNGQLIICGTEKRPAQSNGLRHERMCGNNIRSHRRKRKSSLTLPLDN